MKIAHIVSTFPPYYGGMGNVAFQMVSRLAARGHTVQVMTPLYARDESDPTVREMKEFALRLKPAIAFGNSAYLPGIKQRLEDADLVHLHYPFFGTANLVRKWKLKHPERPLVITYHMDNRAKGWKGLFFDYYAQYWLPKILGAADVLIGSSFDFIASSDARDLYATQKEKWIELPFGVDAERFQPGEKSAALYIEHALDPALPTLVFVGGMDISHYFKGIPVLLEALLLAKKAGTPIQAVLVGDGGLRAEFEWRAQAFQLTDLVRFVGYVPTDVLPDYYRLGDVCVLPSINQGEAFGMVLLEAMACGVPVIASNLPGVRTVAQKGGLVVGPGNAHELADALIGFFSVNADRAAWSKKAREAVVNYYAWDRIIDKLENIYNNPRISKSTNIHIKK